MGFKVVAFAPEILQSMITQDAMFGGAHEVLTCIEGIPADAVFDAGWYESGYGNDKFCAVFEHPSWPDTLADPMQVPSSDMLNPVMQRQLLDGQSENDQLRAELAALKSRVTALAQETKSFAEVAWLDGYIACRNGDPLPDWVPVEARQ